MESEGMIMPKWARAGVQNRAERNRGANSEDNALFICYTSQGYEMDKRVNFCITKTAVVGNRRIIKRKK
jgi:hypothetical protein